MNVRTSIRISAIQELQAAFEDRLKLDEPLARYTSARVGGPAQLFLTVVNSAVGIGNGRFHRLCKKHIPYFLLGGGSNILVSDYGISGLVIMNQGAGKVASATPAPTSFAPPSPA
jgi:UDP-N-acetylmuramate dehydrogenase